MYEELIKGLKVCGGEGEGCSGCPYEKDCTPGGGPNLLMMAAEALEKLQAENAELRRDSEALAAAMGIGTVAQEWKKLGAITELPEGSFEGMA